MSSFSLTPDFVQAYAARKVDWGFTDAGGNSFGELVFVDKYSRIKEDGSKERWHEVCQRVTEGTYSVQKDHAKTNRLPWNDRKAQASAQEFYERMFEFKWLPPGRGLWMMGTPLVVEDKNSAALQNCAFVSTADMTRANPAEPFAFLMEASMLGVGVGFDTLGAAKGFTIHDHDEHRLFNVPIEDSREGWVASTSQLINAYLMGRMVPIFNYSQIRAAGEPIKRFGGKAAGPEPLIRLHRYINDLFAGRDGQSLTTTDIVDLQNMIGQCVVAGNVRRSAELAMGEVDDKEFLSLKDWVANPERMHYCSEACGNCGKPGWGGLSNNSVSVTVGTDYTPYLEGIARNGEPGLIWMDVSRASGRLVDAPNGVDHRAMGYNPCAEQTLESYEMCTLVETFISRHDSLEDYQRTLKFAYLYAKTVTLLPTHWERTNAIMQRNRRIGCSISGIAEFADKRGITELREWMNAGYSTVKYYDKTYSEWLCVRESNKMTSIKPSGTVSLLAGVTPGVHYGPGGEYFMRRLRVSTTNPLVGMFKIAGYIVEPDVTDPTNTVVVSFPIHSNSARSQNDVTMWEKANLAMVAQRYWADNSVSVTISFDPETEATQIGNLLNVVEGQLKTVSFLALDKNAYPQMPYAEITPTEYEQWGLKLMTIPTDDLYTAANAVAPVGEEFCTTDVCEVPNG